MTIPDYRRAAMIAAGVRVPAEAPPPSPSEQMTADSLGLRIEEIRFARRIGCSPERYAAAKSIRSLADHEAALDERRRKAG